MNTVRPIHRVLVSVYYKDGLDILAQAFITAGTQVVSTGSTAQALEKLGVHVIPVSEVTGFPECLGGRVKTLDPHIHAGILADMTNDQHAQELSNLAVEPFDMVIVNLYPFVETVNSGAAIPECIEKIDIGGPTMIRAAAKNARSVAVITDPQDYRLAANIIAQQHGFTLEQRQALASKAFAHTAAYDAAISQWMNSTFEKCQQELQDARNAIVEECQDLAAQASGDETLEKAVAKKSETQPSLPSTWTQSWSLDRQLRYGENPHQQAALYVDTLQSHGLAKAVQLGGKPMSYNNYVDADAAWRAAWDFAPRIAVAVVKHNNPCGIAVGNTVEEAHRKAHECDPMSAYGGVIASTVPVNLAMAQQVRPIFTEVIVAPDYEPEALALLQEKKKNLRILKVEHQDVPSWQMRQIDGGLLVQSSDTYQALGDDPQTWKLVAGEPANEQDMADLVFAWRAIRCVKSNAVLLAHDEAAVGIGMGQVNRVDACHLCVERANTLAGDLHRAQGSVAASDAFFPFADGVEYLINAGVKAIVQPGGSIRDEEVFETARQHGVTMYVTGTRHFLH